MSRDREEGMFIAKETDQHLSYLKVLAFVAGLMDSQKLSAWDISHALALITMTESEDNTTTDAIKISCDEHWLLAEHLLKLMTSDH